MGTLWQRNLKRRSRVKRKTKSLRDLRDQFYRIENNSDDARADRALNILRRYTENIRNTKRYQKVLAKAEEAERNGGDGLAILRGARGVQYSQNTYMGLNAG